MILITGTTCECDKEPTVAMEIYIISLLSMIQIFHGDVVITDDSNAFSSKQPISITIIND